MNCKTCSKLRDVPINFGYQCIMNHKLNEDLSIPDLCIELHDYEGTYRVMNATTFMNATTMHAFPKEFL